MVEEGAKITGGKTVGEHRNQGNADGSRKQEGGSEPDRQAVENAGLKHVSPPQVCILSRGQ